MGNSLLDFVMRLVRDPEAAARFAADPTGSLSDAALAGVTPADVHNLLPVVADSIAMSTPRFPELVSRPDPTPDAGADGRNVWTSGAATAAFAAFDPGSGAADPVEVAPAAVASPDQSTFPESHSEPSWPESPWPLDESQSFRVSHDAHHDAHHDVDPGFDLL